MIVTINGKIVKPRKEPQNKPLMSRWFKKWLLIIGPLYMLFLLPTTLFGVEEAWTQFYLSIFLVCITIYMIIIVIRMLISLINFFLNFKMVIYRAENPKRD